jgi:hypothetical protein
MPLMGLESSSEEQQLSEQQSTEEQGLSGQQDTKEQQLSGQQGTKEQQSTEEQSSDGGFVDAFTQVCQAIVNILM